MMATPSLSDTQLDVAKAMRVDGVTAEVVGAFRAAGIRSLLLKGPAIGVWLYDDSVHRCYGDVDLLVAPQDDDAARRALTRLGFQDLDAELSANEVERLLELNDLAPHAFTWVRPGSRVAVDLHHTLHGVAADRQAVWEVLAAEAELRELRGVPIETPSPEARALVVALHAAWNGTSQQKSLEDLDRAVERLPESLWRRTAALAARLDAVELLATGLRLRPRGASLADALRLPAAADVEVAIRAAGMPPMALGFERLASTRGLRPRLALAAEELFPPPLFMRHSSPLARRGTAGLALAYLRRLPWLVQHAWGGFHAWRRARRDTR
jgi:hypothetical protein